MATALGIACGAGFDVIARLTADLPLLMLSVAGVLEDRYFRRDHQE